MKRVPVIQPQGGPPSHWRSLDHLAEKPQVKALIEREFPDGADTIDAPSRRSFMTLMSASLAMMGLAGCIRRPEEKLIPYQKMPENLIPGLPQYYASVVPVHGEGLGILAECHEGRPTKLDGNPDHPSSLGGTLPYVQALTLSLYDPDRVRGPQEVGGDGVSKTTEHAYHKLDELLDSHAKKGGNGLRVLMEPTTSPTAARLRAVIAQKLPRAKVVEYSALGASNARAGAKLALGEALRCHVAYDKANVVIAADSDFLYGEPGAILATKQFSRKRRIRKAADKLNRLYVAEPAFTVTGMNADHRLITPASSIEDFLLSLASELIKKGVSLGALTGKIRSSGVFDAKFMAAAADDLAKNKGQSVVVVGARQSPLAHAIGLAINDALGNVGRTVTFARLTEGQQTDGLADLRGLVDELNKNQVETLLILGGNPVYTAPGDLKLEEAIGKAANRFYVASYFDETAAKCGWVVPRAHELEAWGDLRAADGTVSIAQPLIAPLFDGKSDIELLAMVAREPQPRGYDLVRATFEQINLAMTGGDKLQPVTAAEAAVPAGSATPAGSAAPAGSGSAAPMASGSAAPAPSGLSPAAKLVAVASAAAASSASPAASGSAKAAGSAAPMVSGSAAPMGSGSAAPMGSGSAAPPAPPPTEPMPKPTLYPEKAWRKTLHDGLIRGTASAPVQAKIDADAMGGALGKRPQVGAPSAQALEVTFAPDLAILDGRYSNISWLLELPNPVTKLVWDNAAWISPKLADELGLTSGDVVKLAANGQTIEIPVWIVPGTADYSVQLHLGWGRKMVGRIATPEAGPSRIRGFNVGPLRTVGAYHVATGVKLDKPASPNQYALVVTQEHQMLEGRPIAQEVTLEEYRKPDFKLEGVEHPPLLPLWDERKYDGYKWGMVIDLSTCTGCSACVVACQAENNIPTVGKEQVARQREMHWLRIDRYFSGSPENPKVVNQPMACVHCENAPCENVCPVNATSHSPEGLNEMTYNRCIGTRYCSNNCPYKARRFNFLDFHEAVPETIKMVANPNVTVRMRGVMEKCSYCVQRIQSAKIAGKREKRKVRDGDIKTACQTACPADAIVFGDLNDRNSTISRVAPAQHAFAVLEELNTKPRTTYLAKIRNPNPELA